MPKITSAVLDHPDHPDGIYLQKKKWWQRSSFWVALEVTVLAAVQLSRGGQITTEGILAVLAAWGVFARAEKSHPSFNAW